MTPPQPRLPAAYRLVLYDTVDSTNDEAKRLARAGAEEGTLVWGAKQTAGRGRRGHTWISPPGNLYASLILRPRCPIDQAAQLGFVTALAIGDTLASICEERRDAVSYKWPNDVLLDGRKISGILLESELGSEGEAPLFVVVGTGLNLISSPRDTEFPATSIAEEGFRAVSPGAALEEFARHFEAWEERWREEGFAPVRAVWRKHAAALGEQIRVRLDAASLQGWFLDIDQHGTLLLECAGQVRRISAGEIFPANP
jgi:BirA family transcriptional regulator, biotin operon repressor / biotin---[acetyl-CoA-carboxylase] ligase